MNKIKLKYWFRPTVDIYINLGFLEAGTQLMNYRTELDIFTYISFNVRLLQWRASFRWYETAQSMMLRGAR